MTLHQVVEIGQALGLGGVVATLVSFARRRLTIEGRRALLVKRVDHLFSETLDATAAGDASLGDALQEERKAALFELISGMRATREYRAMLVCFLQQHKGRYDYDDLRKARSIGQWNGTTFVAHAGRADRAVNALYRWMSFAMIPVGGTLAVLTAVAHMPSESILSSFLILGTGVATSAFFSAESRAHQLSKDLQTFSSVHYSRCGSGGAEAHEGTPRLTA